ncbi:N-6 DNA methylase [Treponema sp. OMZ 805]|uniref:N-6 DNA methylase n=1 Tax=Treponema sp. OMZ 805 TaxID=2726068 RepID=UPI003D8CBF37
MPPAGNANYAWIQHMIHHLSANGKIGLVLANGVSALLSPKSSAASRINLPENSPRFTVRTQPLQPSLRS